MGSRLHGSDDCAIHVAGGDAVCFNWAVMTNTLYYGDNLDILREHVPDESVDLVYLDPPLLQLQRLLQRAVQGTVRGGVSGTD